MVLVRIVAMVGQDHVGLDAALELSNQALISAPSMQEAVTEFVHLDVRD